MTSGSVIFTSKTAGRRIMAITSSTSPSLHNVFVYGSLLADEVVELVLRRVPASSPAILNGFHRFSIKGRLYPAILPVENKSVTGKVLQGVTDSELDALDAFEDVEYKRGTVDISLLDNSEKIQAYTYIWGDKDDPDLYGFWDFEEWKQLHMKEFLAMTKSFMEEIEQSESKTRLQVFKEREQLQEK